MNRKGEPLSFILTLASTAAMGIPQPHFHLLLFKNRAKGEKSIFFFFFMYLAFTKLLSNKNISDVGMM